MGASVKEIAAYVRPRFDYSTKKEKRKMMDFDIFNDSEDEYASPEQREEMRELGINPDKVRNALPFVGFDMGNVPVWGLENEA